MSNSQRPVEVRCGACGQYMTPEAKAFMADGEPVLRAWFEQDEEDAFSLESLDMVEDDPARLRLALQMAMREREEMRAELERLKFRRAPRAKEENG